MTILDVFERLFWELGTRLSGLCRCRGLKQSHRMDCTPGKKEEAVVERWLLVEVRLYNYLARFYYVALCDS